jgi:transposase
MRPGYQWTRTPAWERSFAKRRKRSLPRWKRAFQMRKSGMKYWQIAEQFGCSIATVFKFAANYEEHRLNREAAKQQRRAA